MRILQKVCIFAADISTYKVIMNMKKMKSFGYFLMLLVLGVGFCSCGDDYESRLPELLIKNMEFESSKEDITLSQTFRNEDLTNYGITSDANWCMARIDYDASTIYVTVYGRGQSTDDDPYSARSCTLTMTDVRDNTVRSFAVSQKQLNEVLVNGNSYQVPSEGGEFDVEVQHNVSFKVVVPDGVTWIRQKVASGTRALETSTVTMVVDANNSGSARGAQFSIQSTDGTIERKFSVIQTFTPVYSIETKEFTVDELEQTVSVKVEANFKFDTNLESDWTTSDGRETVDDTHFVQKIKVGAFTEKAESRSTNVEFYAHILTAEGTYRDITETVAITQERTLYIPKDTLYLNVGDSAVVEVTNTKKRDLTWSTSDDKEFTVDAKGQVKCVGNEGDGKATITVKSKDGKYSDKIIAVAKKPVDMTRYLVCKWDSVQTITAGVSTKTLTFKIANNSDASIELTYYSYYQDSLATVWKGGPLTESLAAKGSRTFELDDIPTSNYYMQLEYTYMKENYILGYSKKGVMTIKKKEAPAAATTRRSRR